jgi:hypothetical protein
MLHFIFFLPLILVILLIEEQRLLAAMLLMPLVMAVQFALCLGIGYLAAALSIVFRDTTDSGCAASPALFSDVDILRPRHGAAALPLAL